MGFYGNPVNIWETPAGVISPIERRDAVTSSALGGTGSVVAGLSICKVAGTYTQIRTFITAVGSGVTSVKMGVYSSDGVTLLSESPNFVASLVVNTWVTQTLSTPLTLAAGDRIYLGFGLRFTTTAATIRGSAVLALAWPATLAEGELVYRSRGGGSWTSDAGALPGSIVPNTGPGYIPLVEMIP